MSGDERTRNGDIAALLSVMARLRDPEAGCPWDVEQTYETIAPYTIEEAYEVADAIQRGDLTDLKEELGDLLLQVVFHSRIAEEAGEFAFPDVVEAIVDKMVRRHPHVFGDDTMRDSAAQTRAWEAQKAEERAAKGKDDSLLDDVPAALPALLRAVKLQKRAARVGFDWPETRQVMDKIHEEMAELSEAVIELEDPAKIEEELGDLLFVYSNLSRKLKVDPEHALRQANAKFERRFHYIERALADQGRTPDDATLDEMDALWNEAKKA